MSTGLCIVVVVVVVGVVGDSTFFTLRKIWGKVGVKSRRQPTAVQRVQQAALPERCRPQVQARKRNGSTGCVVCCVCTVYAQIIPQRTLLSDTLSKQSVLSVGGRDLLRKELVEQGIKLLIVVESHASVRAIYPTHLGGLRAAVA